MEMMTADARPHPDLKATGAKAGGGGIDSSDPALELARKDGTIAALEALVEELENYVSWLRAQLANPDPEWKQIGTGPIDDGHEGELERLRYRLELAKAGVPQRRGICPDCEAEAPLHACGSRYCARHCPCR